MIKQQLEKDKEKLEIHEMSVYARNIKLSEDEQKT